MSLEIHLIRHAEANSNPEIICGRSNHIELTPQGIGQAHRLGEILLRKNILNPFSNDTRVDSSPAVRALQTAGHAMTEVGMTRGISVNDMLQERSHGVLEGHKRSEVLNDKVLREMEELQLDFKHFHGESINEVAHRGESYIDKLAEKYQSGRVVTFTHCAFILSTVGKKLGWDYHKIKSTRLPHASVTTLIYEEGTWELEEFGATAK